MQSNTRLRPRFSIERSSAHQGSAGDGRDVSQQWSDETLQQDEDPGVGAPERAGHDAALQGLARKGHWLVLAAAVGAALWVLGAMLVLALVGWAAG